MRFVATLLAWLLTTAALVVAVPAGWAQRNLIDVDGYTALVQRAATDPALQDAVASELASRVSALAGVSRIDPARVRAVAAGYTASPVFPRQLGQASLLAHRWMFTDRVGTAGDGWVIDVAPMLRDSAFADLRDRYDVAVPETLNVPLGVDLPDGLRPGRLAPLATWGPWVSVSLAVLAGVGALLTVLAARRRGRAVASLGVCALLAGATGYAGIEIGRRRLGAALTDTTPDMHRIIDAVVDAAGQGLHHWLNLTLAAGGVLVALGVTAAMLGRLLRRQPG